VLKDEADPEALQKQARIDGVPSWQNGDSGRPAIVNEARERPLGKKRKSRKVT